MCRSSPTGQTESTDTLGPLTRDLRNDKSGARLTSSVKHLVRVFARHGQLLRHLPEQFHHLCHMVIVLVILHSRLGIKQVIARQKLEELRISSLHTFVLGRQARDASKCVNSPNTQHSICRHSDSISYQE